MYAVDGVTLLGRGEVQTVNVSVNQGTGTIILKASFPNEQEKLWPGDFVDCRIVVDKQNDGLTVPSASVRQGPKGDYVWVVTANNAAELRPVRVRQSLGGTSLVHRAPARRVIRLSSTAISGFRWEAALKLSRKRTKSGSKVSEVRMNFSAPFIVRPIATTLLVIAVVMVGLLGLRQINGGGICRPSSSRRSKSVTTSWPGASPDVMETSIPAPLEHYLGPIPGLGLMSSSSASGTSQITLQFEFSQSRASTSRRRPVGD